MAMRKFAVTACLVVVHAFLLCSLGNAQTEQRSKGDEVNTVWTWKDNSGRTRTREDLRSILNQHKLWLESDGKSGERANLQNADLTFGRADHAWQLGSELQGVNLSRADLSGINLSFADLTGADLSQAKLPQAKLAATQLEDADLSLADFNGAMLLFANLTAARMIGTEFKDADFYGADLKLAIFEPKSLPDVTGIGAAQNLDATTYIYFPIALATLRKQFENTGLREQERRINYALMRSETEHILIRQSPFVFFVVGPSEKRKKQRFKIEVGAQCIDSPRDCAEYGFRRVFFDFTCRYGMEPLRPLRLLIVVWLFCSLVYVYFIETGGHSGLYKIEREYRDGTEIFREVRIRPRLIPAGRKSERIWLLLGREMGLLRIAILFSAMSAFNLGFRDFNFGRWARAVMHEEYDIRARGWVRTFAGIQALISIYLLALSVLTYFGRPFA